MRAMLPVSRASNIYPVVVGADPVKLAPQNDGRRALFLQNTNTVAGQNIEFCTSSGQNPGFVLAASGAFLADLGLTEEIWARSTSGVNTTVIVFESFGYDAYETEVLNLLGNISNLLEILVSGAR